MGLEKAHIFGDNAELTATFRIRQDHHASVSGLSTKQYRTPALTEALD